MVLTSALNPCLPDNLCCLEKAWVTIKVCYWAIKELFQTSIADLFQAILD